MNDIAFSFKTVGYIWKYEDEHNSSFEFTKEKPDWFRDFMTDVVMVPIIPNDVQIMFNALAAIVDTDDSAEMRKLASDALNTITDY